MERRIYQEAEIRAVEDPETKSKKLEGYAARFNVISENLGGFREKIAPGAFKKSIKKDDVRALKNHDANYVLGRSSAGTLKMKEDEGGLKVSINPPDTQWARDLIVSVERGDIDQMSFGFRVVSDKWETENKENLRTLEQVDLIDVSVVTFPAYPQTSIQTRSLFRNCGIDVDNLERVIVRHEHGLALDDEDRAEIRKTVGLLNSLEVSGENPEEPVQEPANEENLFLADLRKKRLSLRDRQLKP